MIEGFYQYVGAAMRSLADLLGAHPNTYHAVLIQKAEDARREIDTLLKSMVPRPLRTQEEVVMSMVFLKFLRSGDEPQDQLLHGFISNGHGLTAYNAFIKQVVEDTAKKATVHKSLRAAKEAADNATTEDREMYFALSIWCNSENFMCFIRAHEENKPK